MWPQFSYRGRKCTFLNVIKVSLLLSVFSMLLLKLFSLNHQFQVTGIRIEQESVDNAPKSFMFIYSVRILAFYNLLPPFCQ